MARAQLAVAYLETGDISSAERVFTEYCLQWAQESQDVYYAILTNKELVEIWILRGRLSQAEQLYKQMYDWIQQTVQKPALYNGLIKVYEASLLIEKNDLESARRLLQEDIESILSVWRTTSLYFGYTVMAYLYTGFRDFQQARVAIEKAIHWLPPEFVSAKQKHGTGLSGESLAGGRQSAEARTGLDRIFHKYPPIYRSFENSTISAWPGYWSQAADGRSFRPAPASFVRSRGGEAVWSVIKDQYPSSPDA